MEAMKTKPALPELLSCPKCKSRGAQLQQPRPDRFWVLCGNPDCDMAVSINWWASPQEAVAAWNGHKLRMANAAGRRMLARLAAERLADRNRRWEAAIDNCILDNVAVVFSDIELAAVFDAIASEASCGEIPEALRR